MTSLNTPVADGHVGEPREGLEDRREPGTGEIHYPAVAATMRKSGYSGVVGLEGWASTDSEQSLAPAQARSKWGCTRAPRG